MYHPVPSNVRIISICYYTRTKRANDDVQKTASTQTDREQPPETTEGVIDSGQGHAGASAGQVGGVGETLTEAEVERLARRHANLSWTICYSRGCLFHKGAKEAARYWPEDHARPERRVKKLTRQAKKGQEHQGARSGLVRRMELSGSDSPNTWVNFFKSFFPT